MDHRAKNALAVVQAIVRLARRDDIEEFVSAVEGRIKALAQTHELLSRSRWKGADVLRLVLDEMAPYQGAVQRVTAIGPAVTVSPANAQTFAIALHELATNAAKYGSLSTENGRVDISWSCFEDTLKLTWKESGGPLVKAPRSRGFGTKIIQASFSNSHRSQVEFDWKPEGLCCSLKMHLGMEEEAAADVTLMPAADKNPDARRILLVEDEPLVGLLTQNMLTEMGFVVTNACHTLQEAMTAAKTDRFDGAVLDMNLSGTPVYPLADLLTAKGIPFIFVTGYSSEVVEKRFGGVPLVQKPIDENALVEALTGLFVVKNAELGSARVTA